MVPDAVTALEKKLALSSHGTDAQALLRNIHRTWKAAGGTVGGKPRHSDRFLTEQLKAQNTVVRSLTPKLAGSTRIKKQDAEILAAYFLFNWPQTTDPDTEEVDYSALLDKRAIDAITDYITDEIENVPSGPKSHSDELVPGEEVLKLMTSYYAQGDAFMIVGTQRAVAPTPTTASYVPLQGFRDLMNDFWEIELSDGRPRPLIWIADYGRQNFDDPESAFRFVRIQELVTRFKALEIFEDRRRNERLKWLRSRATFLVLDTRFEQDINMKGFKRPNFVTHHVSFSAIPAEWAKSAAFRALYGSHLDRLTERVFAVFLNGKGHWHSGGDDEEMRYRRYFGFGSFSTNDRSTSEQIGRALELPSPGASYEEALKTVYAAAVSLLGLQNRAHETHPVEGQQAIEQLKYLGFRLLRLDEFTRL